MKFLKKSLYKSKLSKASLNGKTRTHSSNTETGPLHEKCSQRGLKLVNLINLHVFDNWFHYICIYMQKVTMLVRRKGFLIIQQADLHLSRDAAEQFYSEHRGTFFK